MAKVLPVLDQAWAVKAFVEQGLWGGARQFDDSYAAIGFADDARGLVAGFVYTDWQTEAGTIELSAYAACRDWMTREALALLLYRYPFGSLGCRLVVARHSERNAPVRRIWRALGAHETLIPELWGPGEATAIAVLKTADFCNSKFMRGQDHGKK